MNFFFSLILLVIAIIPITIISVIVKFTSKGPVIHWSERIGKNNSIFFMPKFRTMYINAPQVATHLLDGKSFITPVGKFLRKSSLDELPQLWSVITGKMNFVGPRPALFNQYDLISLRTSHGIHQLKPGITGWAQINGRDELSIDEKVFLDKEYLEKKCLLMDAKILILTFFKVILKKDISH